MAIANITIPLDQQTANIYTGASTENKKKLRLLLGLWLREFAVAPRSLDVIMDQLNDRAQARGLTPEILETLLNEN